MGFSGGDSSSSSGVPSMSLAGATFNVVMTSVGIGLVGMPVAMSEAGYLLGSFMIMLCGCASMTTAVLLVRSAEMAERVGGRPVAVYEDIGAAAFGTLGKCVMALTNNVMLIGAVALMVIILGQSSHHLVPELSLTLWFFIWMALMVPVSLLRTMEHVGRLSAWLGIPSVAAVCAWVIFVGALEGINSSHEYSALPHSPQDVATSFATLCFAFAANCTLVQIRHDMAEPLLAGRAAIYGFSALMGSFFVVSMAGYFGYGESIVDNGFDTIAQAVYWSAGGLGSWAGSLLAVLLILLCVSHYAVCLNPVSQSVERMLGFTLDAKKDASMSDVESSTSKREIAFASGVSSEKLSWVGRQDRGWQVVMSAAVRVGLVFVSGLVAVYIPKFMAFLDIVGAVTCNVVQLLYPLVLFYRLQVLEGASFREAAFGNTRKSLLFGTCCGIFVLFLGGMSLGLLDAIKRFQTD